MKKILITFFVILLIGCSPINPPLNITVSPTPAPEIGDIIEFQGPLTAYDDSCKFDAQCVATVGEYKIITNPGLVPNAIVGQSDISTADIGHQVKVKAKVILDNQLTIIGDKQLYVLKTN